MPVRYWMLVIALGGCLTIGTFSVYALSPGANYQHQQRIESETQAKEHPAALIQTVDDTTYPYPAECPNGSSECRDWEDLEVQRSMAEAADQQSQLVKQQNSLLTAQNWLVGIEAFLLFLTLAAAVYAAIKARQSAEAAEEHVVRLERPYFTIQFSKDARTPEISKPMRIDIKNIGRIFGILGVPKFQIYITATTPSPLSMTEDQYRFGAILESGRSNTFDVYKEMISGEIRNIGINGQTAYLVGVVPYIHGRRKYVTGVCLRYDPKLRLWGHEGDDTLNFMT